jgi:archaellin
MKNKYFLILISIVSINCFSQITNTQVIDNANSYINHNWNANSNNIWNNLNCGGKTVNTPNWVSVGNHTSLPYCWGGNSTLNAFDNYLLQGKSAGDDNTNVGFGVEPNCSIGVDCSGYISRCYGLSSHYSTNMLNSNNLFGHYNSFNDLKVGDFVNKPGNHARLVTQINNDGTITFLESGSGTGNVGGDGLWKVFQWTYSISTLINDGYNPQYYTNMSDGNGGNTPGNDNCNDAITLQSNQNCNYIDGSVNNATSDNTWNDATCDFFPENSLAADVFYKFIAVSETHLITVDPIGDLDAVVSLYQGSDCLDANEIECEDTSGGTGITTIMNADNLNIGTRYWIRIYDYGSQPPSNGDFDICVTHTPPSNSEDIFLTDANVSPTTMEVGDTVDMDIEQNYNGNSNSVPDVYLYYYLSEDCDIDGSDLLIHDGDFSTIDEGDTSDTESHSFEIPNGTSPGTYYILFQADATDVINEDNENNNVECIEITVTGTSGGEDIFLTDANVSPTTMEVGDTVDMDIEQNYSGNSNSVPDVFLHYYLSEDCDIDGSDLLIHDGDFSTIDEGDASDRESHSFEIPNGTSLGTYYILFKADATDVINEDNENNNVECIEIEIEETLSIDKLELNSSIKIYPNPADNILNWDAQNVEILDINMFNVLGQKVSCTFDREKKTIYISSLKSGVYFVNFISLNNSSITLKIVKK